MSRNVLVGRSTTSRPISFFVISLLLLTVLATGVLGQRLRRALPPTDTRTDTIELEPLADRDKDAEPTVVRPAPNQPIRPGLLTPLRRGPESVTIPSPALEESEQELIDQTVRQADMRLHIEWGGGTPRRWSGEIHLEQGSLLEATPIGFEPMPPGGWLVRDNSVVLRQPNPRAYDGVAIKVATTLEESLLFSFRTEQAGAQTFSVPLKDLAQGSQSFELDDNGNRLLVRRAPGDELRVKWDRTSTIFEPLETVTLFVVPNLLDGQPFTNRRCRVQLIDPRDQRQLWDFDVDTAVKPDARMDELGPYAVPMPRTEGIYELAISFEQTNEASARKVPTWSHTRKLQVVVLAKQLAEPGNLVIGRRSRDTVDDPAPWRTLQTIDPTAETLSLTTSTGIFANNRSVPRLGASVVEQVQINGQNFASLSPGERLEFPLHVEAAGEPHRLRIRYADQAQQLGLAILEPSLDGQAIRKALDTVLDVESTGGKQPGEPDTCDAVYWPQSDTALLVVTNRSEQDSAVFGSIEVATGPDSLNVRSDSGRDPRSERLLAAVLDTPSFAALFGATTQQDEISSRFLTDWRTFHDGTKRLIQYLKHAGYNAAVVPVIANGGTLYPSQVIPGTMRYDNGLLFTNGQDPFRKDVLELMFRMFDREGLRLIPSVEFAMTLPELDALVAAGEPGIELMNGHQTWRGSHPEAATGPFYNPLNANVQAEMQRVLIEIVEQYAQHPSLAGISIDLNSKTYARFPGVAWGIDPQSTSNFNAAAGVRRGLHFSNETQDEWLEWRAEQLAGFYGETHQKMVELNSELRLFLAGNDLLASLGEAADTTRERLPQREDVRSLLLAAGLDPQAYSKPGVVVLRPHHIAHREPDAFDSAAAYDKDIDEVFRAVERSNRGTLLVSTRDSYSISSDDLGQWLQVSDPRCQLRPYTAPMGSAARRAFVHSLSAHDPSAIFVTGSLRPAGTAEGLAALFARYRSLPLEPLDLNLAGSGQPLTIRQRYTDERAYLCVSNDSPWPVTTAVDFQASGPLALNTIADNRPVVVTEQDGHPQWQLKLAPYETAVAFASPASARVVSTNAKVAHIVLEELAAEIDLLQQRLRSGRHWQVLADPGFEQTPAAPGLAAWRVAKGADMVVAVDRRNVAAGNSSLYLRSTSPVPWSQGPVVWIRSAGIPAPESRRVSFQAKLRAPNQGPPPRVRFIVEGVKGGEPFYRQQVIGGDQSNLTPEWALHGIWVDDLPSEGVTEFRVGIDLLGTGEVWIDDAKLFDVWMNEAEVQQGLKELDIAAATLAKGRLQDCRRALTGVLPQFIRHQFDFADSQIPETRSATPAEQAEPLPRTERDQGPTTEVEQPVPPNQDAAPPRTAERNHERTDAPTPFVLQTSPTNDAAGPPRVARDSRPRLAETEEQPIILNSQSPSARRDVETWPWESEPATLPDVTITAPPSYPSAPPLNHVTTPQRQIIPADQSAPPPDSVVEDERPAKPWFKLPKFPWTKAEPSQVERAARAPTSNSPGRRVIGRPSAGLFDFLKVDTDRR
jgi:hypothetical protein